MLRVGTAPASVPERLLMVWLLPRLTAEATPLAVLIVSAPVPIVPLPAVLSVPPITVVAPPRLFVPDSVSVPAPDLVIELFEPMSLTAPKVSVPIPTPLLATLKVTLPASVVAPKVRPYAWFIGAVVAVTFSVVPVPLPTLRVPIVNVVAATSIVELIPPLSTTLLAYTAGP